MHSARGLQFRIVLLLWADLLPSPFKSRDDGIDRGLLYVAMTRAEDMLVILHSGSSSYVEELYRALGTVPLRQGAAADLSISRASPFDLSERFRSREVKQT